MDRSARHAGEIQQAECRYCGTTLSDDDLTYRVLYDGFTTHKPTDSPIRPPEIDHLPVREGALDELDDLDSRIVKPTF